MVSLRTILITVIFSANAVTSANAGTYTNHLSECLVESTSTRDRIALVKWMFSAASLHPAVKPIALVSEQQLDEANKNAAHLFTKLLTDSCKQETQKALKFEGNLTLQASFEVLGQIAGRELFSSPEVNAAMSGMEKYLDQEKLNSLTKTN